MTMFVVIGAWVGVALVLGPLLGVAFRRLGHDDGRLAVEMRQRVAASADD